MAETVYNAILTLLGSRTAAQISEIIATVFGALEKSFKTGGAVPYVVDGLAGVALALVSVFFLYDLFMKLTREMLTPEKFLMQFVKLVLAIGLLLYLKDILENLCMIGKYFFQGMQTANISADSQDFRSKFVFFKDGYYLKDAAESKFATLKAAKKVLGDDFFSAYDGGIISGTLNSIGIMMKLILPYILSIIAEFASNFIIISQAAMFMVYAMVSPFAIVQVFDDSGRPQGIRYLKKLVAYAISFGLILLAVKATDYLGLQMTQKHFENLIKEGTKGIYATESNCNVDDVLTLETIIQLSLVKLASIGGMGAAVKIGHDIFQ